MSKKTIYILSGSLFLVLIVLVFMFLKPKPIHSKSDLIEAIPATSPLFVKINKPAILFQGLSGNPMVETLNTLPGFHSFFEHFDSISSFINQNNEYQKLLRGNEVFLVLNYSGRNDINPILLISLKSKTDIATANNLINHFKTNPTYRVESRKYNRVHIYEIKADNYALSLSINKGVLIISNKSIMVEETIAEQINDEPDNNNQLAKLFKTMSFQADLNLFINHKHAERLLKKIASSELTSLIGNIENYAQWTELDINITNNNIMIGGFSLTDMVDHHYANLLLKQQATASRISKVLPLSTAFYLTFTLSNAPLFFEQYQEYLTKRNLFFQRENSLLKIESETGTNIQKLLIELLNQETAIASTNVDQANTKSGRVWIIETKSGSTAQNKMIDLQNRYIQKNKLNANDWVETYKIDNQTIFNIYKFPYPNLPQLLFGQAFGGIDANWFAVIDNYLIFGDAVRTISRTLHSNILGETLSTSMEYNKHVTNFNAKSNITFYCNTAISLPIANVLFNKNITTQIAASDDLRKFKSAGWQISSAGNMIYNNAFIVHGSELKSKPQTIWQSHIESNFDFKPKLVINHSDPLNKEVVLQDNNNGFYLINNIGRVVWRIKLNEKIISEIHQIDYLKNGKLQYLFNTENKLYLIDRNGNNIKSFPVTFRAKATNGVAVFDYDNNKDYRYFVACADNNIYAYNNDGNLLNGWDIFKTDHAVTQPLQHFRIDGKDFIVASDKMKDYLLHRKGTIRVKTNEVYPHSPNNPIYLEERTAVHEPRLVTTDTQGSLHYTYFDGKHEVMNHNINVSENHFFVADDVSGDSRYEYIYSDENQVFIIDQKGKTILKKKLDYKISHRPNIYTFSSNLKKIGITSKEANKILLFDINGTSHPGFPLDGCTEFSIGFITSELSNFNLLVGSPDGYLYNYYVE